MARTSGQAKTKIARLNKSQWIRTLSTSLSAREIVEKAQTEGITLTLAQVYTARATAKHSSASARRARASNLRGAAHANRGKGGDLSRQFAMMATRIGIDEAQRILDALIRRQVR